MSYIGQIPSTTFLQKQSQSFTPDGSTTSFTLDFSVTNEKDLLVVVNNVIQEPGDGKAYTASDNTLLMSEAPASGDSMYCYYLGFTVGTINTPDGSVTKAKTNFITDTSSAGITSKGSGSQAGQIQLNCSANSHGIKLESPPHAVGQSYTLIFPGENVTADDMLQVDSISGSGTTATGTLKFNKINTPSFRATMSADQDGISSETNQKVAFNTETWDFGSCYDHSSNYRFTVPSGEAGYYMILATTHTRSGSGDYSGKTVRLYKNGSFLAENQNALDEDRHHSTRSNQQHISTVELLSAGDYIEVYVKVFGAAFNIESESSYFSAFKLNIGS